MFFSQIIQIEARYITDSGAGYGKRIGYVPICVYTKTSISNSNVKTAQKYIKFRCQISLYFSKTEVKQTIIFLRRFCVL